MPLTIFIYSTECSDKIHPQDTQFYYQLRGQERKVVQEKLANIIPRKYELEVINKKVIDLARSGNMQELKTLNVYQKARSEVNCQYDLILHSLDLQDLMQLWVVERSLSDLIFGMPVMWMQSCFAKKQFVP